MNEKSGIFSLLFLTVAPIVIADAFIILSYKGMVKEKERMKRRKLLQDE